jgi:hypothetical protein
VVFCLLLGLSTILNSLYYLYGYWAQKVFPTTGFYLLEGGNFYRAIRLLANMLLIYLGVRGIFEGYKAWSLLRHCESDDDALLEGSERLGKMFRWLALFGGAYLGFIFLERIGGEFANLMGRSSHF